MNSDNLLVRGAFIPFQRRDKVLSEKIDQCFVQKIQKVKSLLYIPRVDAEDTRAFF
jgi:hypothetical protein